MARIDEHEVFARFIGEMVNEQHLLEIGYPNGAGYGSYDDSKEYIIAHVDYYESDGYIKQFRLTPALIERWDYSGIDFRVYLYVKDGVITGGHIFKYKETSISSHYRPSGYEVTPTQQEIGIARRILEYIVENKEKEGVK